MNSDIDTNCFFLIATINEAQLQSIYDLNQANTPEVGSLESMQLIKTINRA